MPHDIDFVCRCGAFKGRLSALDPGRVSHLVCYCRDCRSYACHLDRVDILDAHGGTEIVQVTPDRIEILDGVEYLECLRLRPGGLLRWYAGCCGTPFANTLPTPAIPFAGIVTAPFRPGYEDAIGPVTAAVHLEAALGDGPPPRRPHGAFTLFRRFIWRALSARFTGAHRRTPFFSLKSGEPVSAPETLSAAAYEGALNRAADPW